MSDCWDCGRVRANAERCEHCGARSACAALDELINVARRIADVKRRYPPGPWPFQRAGTTETPR